MVENLTFNQGVPGSIPGGPTQYLLGVYFLRYCKGTLGNSILGGALIRMPQRNRVRQPTA